MKSKNKIFYIEVLFKGAFLDKMLNLFYAGKTEESDKLFDDFAEKIYTDDIELSGRTALPSNLNELTYFANYSVEAVSLEEAKEHLKNKLKELEKDGIVVYSIEEVDLNDET